MDLKPQNILLTAGSRPRLKLADFGFAQKFSTDQTKTSLRGSPLYMAPEMILKRRYDAKVDLWSTGVIMFECLFGRAPYKSETVDELMAKIVEDSPIVIPESPQISGSCHELLGRCLTRDPQVIFCAISNLFLTVRHDSWAERDKLLKFSNSAHKTT